MSCHNRGALADMTADDLARLLKGISAHSTRVGLNQDLFTSGEDLAGIMDALRWKSPRMAPQLTNPSTGLLQDGVGQIQKLESKPAADLHRPARFLEPGQGASLALGDPLGMEPHPLNRNIREDDPLGPQTTQFLDPLLYVADVPPAETHDGSAKPIEQRFPNIGSCPLKVRMPGEDSMLSDTH